MRNSRWSREQLKLAFHLYCQLPFGKLHSRNAEIMELAQLIGRTPSAVAMKRPTSKNRSLNELLVEEAREVALSESGIRRMEAKGSLLSRLVGKLTR